MLTVFAFLACGVTPRAAALNPQRKITQYQSKHWGPEDGLPCTNVLSVAQTADGYLWLGTEEGLVRFDGVRAQVCQRQLDRLTGGINLSEVVEDVRHPDWPLFVSSTGSIGRLADGELQVIAQDLASTHQPGRTLLQDPADGTLWVGTVHGLYHIGLNGEVAGPDAASPEWPAEPINTLCRDRAGRLWVGSAQGIYRQRETGGKRFEPLADWKGEEVDCIAPARGGGLWVGSRRHGIGWLGEDNAFHPRHILTGGVVTSFLEDRDGMLWVGTFGSGLYRLPAADTAGAGQAAALTTGNGLLDNQVNCLCEDREGNLWIATQNGLQTLQNARFITYGAPEGLAGDNATVIFEDRRNQLWVGTSAGLSVLNATRDQVTNVPIPASPRRPDDNLVLCVGPGDEEDTLLVGTHAGLLRWRHGALQPWPLRDDLDASAVRALCVDAAGNRWVGTGSGLFEVRGDQVLAHLTTADGLPDKVVRGLRTGKDGDLWIATDGGLSRRGGDGRITNYLTAGAGRVLCLAQAPFGSGDLFVSTEFGLRRLHATADGGVKITSYTVQDGLFDNTMFSLLDDGRGNLWMSSNKGIACFAWADLERFDRQEIQAIHPTVFGLRDGLRSREANGGSQPTACRDHTGTLWFATVKGAVGVDPASLRGSGPVPPPTAVEELTADGRTVPLAGNRAPKLPAGTQKFELRYTALNLTAPESDRFQYRLEPFDAGWTDAGTERVAHYTNLPPGNYRFRVRAANGDGVWNENGATLVFALRPHFYQMIWVQGLGVAAVVALGWAWLRQHKRQLVARVTKAEADVRERTRYQEILRASKEEAEHARAEAERASNAKSEFLSRVSHELRTPLNAILGFGQLLEMSDLPSQALDSTAHILKGGRHLLNLVNEVLDIARIETGQANLSLEPVALVEVALECQNLVRRLAAQRNVELKLDSLCNPNLHVMADRQRLRQVLLNLLSNAIKYNRENGIVTLSCRTLPPEPAANGAKKNQLLHVEIADTGMGMSAEDMARLFVPFERLNAAAQNIEGSGLGLAVSKNLIEVMGGRIGVESQVGKGSVFWIELPLTESPAARLAQTELPAAKALSTAPGLVLYIEDNLSNLRLVERLLERCLGVELLSAMQGGLGLEMAYARRPDLILLDLHLPDIPGWEVLASLQADKALRDIPVVVISADATSRQIHRLMSAGARDYLTKPVDVNQLLRVLEEHLRSAQNAPAA